MKANHEGGLRTGVVAGKNVHKTAVRRNFWKRQARAVLTAAIRGNRDAIIILGSRVNELARRQFRSAVEQAVKDLT